MATFVLVHGSFLASWCWREVVPRLESDGHRAVTLDLPGHGADHTPVGHVTMQQYVEAVLRVVRSLDKPPILVGHSMGGPIAGVAESESGAVAGLVFVAGLLPPNGGSLLQGTDGLDPEYLAQIEWADDRRSARVSARGAREFWFSSCPSKLVDHTIPLMTAEPIGPYETPIVTSDEHFGRVPRFYIETLKDRVVPAAVQKVIQARIECRQVFSLDTDHAPFLSAPQALVDSLTSIAGQF
jgi:pimeloyl-ACP methyl ester carboxylesterase